SRRLASSMVAVAAVVSRPRGRRWRRVRKLRHIRRARRGLKSVEVVASRRTARVVAADGHSLRAVVVTTTAGANLQPARGTAKCTAGLAAYSHNPARGD